MSKRDDEEWPEALGQLETPLFQMRMGSLLPQIPVRPLKWTVRSRESEYFPPSDERDDYVVL